jgi:ketosteroid isomerase-like protein
VTVSTVRLSEPLATYVKAKNAHDTNLLLTCFAEDAIVQDEGQDIRGLAAIRAWSDHTIEQYDVTMDVLNAEQTADETVVTARISGTFDGSPVDLKFGFTLQGGKISALRIV